MSLPRWTPGVGATQFDNASNYAGANMRHMFYVPDVHTHRDADVLTRCNFEVALEMLGGESEHVQVHRFSNWAVGWTESILIAPDAPESVVAKAEEIVRKLKNYPILNEDRFSEMEWDEACEAWEHATLADRVEMCREVGVSIFAARRADEMPHDDTGVLQEMLLGY